MTNNSNVLAPFGVSINKLLSICSVEDSLLLHRSVRKQLQSINLVIEKFSLLMFSFILLCFASSFAQNQNVELIANVDDYPTIGYSDCWGYTAPDAREYALLGVNNGISIVEVTDPANIGEVDFIPWVSAPPFGFYDMKTYQNYMYVSSEGSQSILIVDLSALPNPTSVVGEISGLTSSPHNIFVDTQSALLYAAEDFHFNPAVRVYSLADPVNPVEVSTIGTANNGTDVHDIFARDSVLYIAEGTSPTIGIFDMSDPANPTLLARHPIPSAGYVHQVWVTEDNHYMVTTEETPEKTVKFWDIQNLNNITLIDEYLGSSHLAHNAYFKNDSVYISHYESGLKVLDFTNPADVAEVGFYDTYPQGESTNFGGAWGVYPFTGNGMIFLSDQETGLYVLRFMQEQGPQMVTFPANIDFGSVEVGSTSDTITVTLQNFGTQDLTISNISDPGAPFSLYNVPTLPVLLPPHASATFDVTFSPTQTDTSNGTILINSNDTNEPFFILSLTGQGFQLNPAPTGVYYASTGHQGNTPGSLLSVDLTTGAGTLIGSTGLSAVPGLAINSAGDIYAASGFSNEGIGLYRIDAASGGAIFVGNIGQPFMDAIAFDGNDVLYGLGGTPPIATLFVIDTTTGAATPIGSTGFFLRGMAFDPLDGTLWASEGATRDGIVTIEVSTGVATFIGSVGLGGSIPDIHFDQSGNLYGVNGGGQNPNNLISIDKTTGAGTIIGPIGFQAVAGMAARLDRFFPTLAAPGVCYATLGNEDPNAGSLISIDISTGAGTLLGPTGIIGDLGVPGVPALAIKSTGEMFATDIGNSSNLWRLNAATGAAIMVANTGLFAVDALAFDGNDILWAIASDNNLYIVDETTGASTIVGTVGVSIRGMAFDPTTGLLWGGEGGPNATGGIYTIDLSTGAATLIGNTGFGGAVPDLHFDENGNLYGSKGGGQNPNDLIVIDKSTGAGTVIGPIGFQAVAGMAARLDRVAATPAASGVCYATTGMVGTEAGSLIIIDLATGTGTLMGLTGISGDNGAPGVPGLAIKSSGEIYGTNISASANLYRIDAVSGSASMAVSTGLSFPNALAFDGNDVLYAIDDNNDLYMVDEITGATTLIGPTSANIHGLAFDPTAGILWGSEGGSGDGIYTISTTTGAAQLVGNTGLGGPIPDIHFDENGNLYGSKGGDTGPPSLFISIDKTTGAGTVVGSIGSGFRVSGMAARLNRVIVGIDEDETGIPGEFSLEQNYPNPFNPSTTVRYALKENTHVALKIYNLLGQLVRTLVDEKQNAGYREVKWDGRNDLGGKVASGIYIYRIEAGDFRQSRKMVLLK